MAMAGYLVAPEGAKTNITDKEGPAPKRRMIRRSRLSKPAIPLRSRLLALPAELRLQIYHYLTPHAQLSTVQRSRSLGVSSVSHRPPPVAFLLANHQICAEALDLFYRTATFEIEGLLDPANIWPIWQIEQVLQPSPHLKRIQRIEISSFWFRVPGGGIEGVGTLNYAACIRDEVARRRERVKRMADVLRLATDLRVVVLTWKELGRREGEEDEGWLARKQVLKPLEVLAGRARFEVGDLVASKELVSKFEAYVKKLNRAR